MGSFKGDKNEAGPRIGVVPRGAPRRRPTPEGLEERTLLSSLTAQQQQAIDSVRTSARSRTARSAKGGQDLAMLDAASSRAATTYQRVAGDARSS